MFDILKIAIPFKYYLYFDKIPIKDIVQFIATSPKKI